MKQKETIIVGGGITGLATAYIAAKNDKHVVVVEAGKNIGGLLSTYDVGGNQLELFYHHFFTHDAELHWLIKELGIEDKLFYKKTSMGVFKNGKIFNFNTPFDLLKFKPIHFFDKIRFGITTLFLGKIASWRKYEHVSSFAWLNKWAGKSTAKSLWNPLLNIKFGPFSSHVPLTWMIGRMRQRMNSRKSGDERLGYVQGSLQVVLQALLQKLDEYNVEIYTEHPVKSISVLHNNISCIHTSQRDFSGDSYVFTIPSPFLAQLFRPILPDYADFLAQVSYFGAICVVLELDQPLSDVYWLNIADDGYPFGGVIEHTNFIPAAEYDNRHIVYLSRYFALSEQIATMETDEIAEMMIDFLPRINPTFSEDWILKKSVFRTKTAATVCDLGFSQKVPDCKMPLDNSFIINMSHIYPDERSTNNSIRIAAEGCKVMGMNADFVPKNNSLSGQIGFSL
ncbi:MAG: NAD(P)/FAD-dependent oxidoreductase [Bacteroidales bacterium]|nr:NAD(P)/FAD-dependent oxidoreductase [Bacteroidales bacterium]